MTRESLVNRGVLLALIVTCLSGAAFAAPEHVLYSFQNPGPVVAYGNLVADSDGNLYGTDASGPGGGNDGAVYELLHPVPPSAQWTLNVLYTFTGSDGSLPVGGVIFDHSGNLYGTASEGGTYDLGVVFRLTPPATEGGQWTETVLHSFQGGGTDGRTPLAGRGVIFDSSGNLYGVTTYGGDTGTCEGLSCGVVFELTPPATEGGAWTETVIHFFNGGEGWNPVGTPILDGKGNLYGATEAGGKFGYGLVYRLAPPATAGGTWKYKVIYNFTGVLPDGDMPSGSLTLRGDGNLYGVTSSGGQNETGNVFELMPPAVPGGEWTENTLYSFGASSSDGIYPTYNVIFDGAGNLYGTTEYGGGEGTCAYVGYTVGCGTVYELSPSTTEGTNWTETILHRFPAYRGDGWSPSSGLLRSKQGTLFGVTGSGGAGRAGTVYRVNP